MKGGKEGRKRRSSGGGATAPTGGRGKAKKNAAKRPLNAPPKKGSRKKSFGPVTSPDDL